MRNQYTVALFLVLGAVALAILIPGILPRGGPAWTQGEMDKDFLRQIQRDSANYFWEQANPANGLVKDSSDDYAPCSIAAVGFGLVSLCLTERYGWKPHDAVIERLVRTLRTLRDKVEHEHGFFYHFVNMYDGKRVWRSEASSMDTALAIAGALFAGEYFKNTEVDRLAQEIYERVDWNWMMNHHNVMNMGYKPESGFLPHYWDSYNESFLLYALAIGSPTHPVPKKVWWAWKRPLAKSMAGEMVYCRTGSLFVYQYPHAFLDLRHLNDGKINYWRNTVRATLANRFFCIQNRPHFKTYDEDVWGITASLGPDGYKGYGAAPADLAVHDGTVAPFAVAGSLPFTRQLCQAALMMIYRRYGPKVYGRYGFYDAFNVDRDWWAKSYIGINQGLTVVMIENAMEHTVWAYFMKHPAIQQWVDLCMKSKSREEKHALLLPRKTLMALEGLADLEEFSAPVVEVKEPSLYARSTIPPATGLAEGKELWLILCGVDRKTVPAGMALADMESLDVSSYRSALKMIKISIVGWWKLFRA